MPRSISPEIKEAIMSKLDNVGRNKTFPSVAHLARAHNIPPKTVRLWIAKKNNSDLIPLSHLKNPPRENIDQAYVQRSIQEYQEIYLRAPWHDPTFRICGDPLPGRSALDRKRTPQLALAAGGTCARS